MLGIIYIFLNSQGSMYRLASLSLANTQSHTEIIYLTEAAFW